jgi:hypothetical protein
MRKLTTLLLAGALGLGFGARAMADEGKTAGEHQGESVTLTDLPKAAQDTLNREAKGGKIEEVRKETGKDGTVKYEAEIVKNGKGRDIQVSESGKVLERGKAHDESKEPEKASEPSKTYDEGRKTYDEGKSRLDEGKSQMREKTQMPQDVSPTEPTPSPSQM